MSGFFWHTICKALLEKGGQHIGEKENILCVCVNLQKSTDWVSNCFKTLLESWCNNMCSERKTGIFCKDWSVLLCSELMPPSLTLPALLFCSSLSQSISLQFYAASAGVGSQFSTSRLLLQDLCRAVCWERQCMGSTGGVGDFSSSQVWRLQFVRMCLSVFK